MKRLILLGVLLVTIAALTAVALAASSPSAISDASPQQQIAALKKQLRNARLDLADARDQIDAQDAVIGDQADTIARLRYRLANQPDPLDVITSRDPDGLWAAAQALWRAFPTLPAGSLCGYDKSSTQNDGLTPASLSLYRYTVC